MSKQLYINIKKLSLTFHYSKEEIAFNNITYFFGKMGAGKSSIARLIDYCLGGSLNLSPALQSEFVSATLFMVINGKEVSVERTRDSDQVHCSWGELDEVFDIVLPTRDADGIKIPDTEVEVLSDFIFWLAGLAIPRVRKSKTRENSQLERLSIRDLLWYCYLDQDSFDNDFFHLGEDTNPFKRLKSRDVLRFILGFHQEEVAALESELQRLHLLKIQYAETAKSLKEALSEVNIGSEKDIQLNINELTLLSNKIQLKLHDLRTNKINTPHGTDILKATARDVSYEIEALDDSIPEIKKIIDQDTRHKNEIIMLGLKVQRVAGARAILSGVEFKSCPRCTQLLPEREQNHCKVCGQEELNIEQVNVSTNIIDSDSKSRITELQESIELHKEQLARMLKRLDEKKAEKRKIDSQINQEMASYDSAYLSSALTLEKRLSEIKQSIINYEKMIALPRKTSAILKKMDEVQAIEIRTRRELEEARKGAEADLTNLNRLEELFLDCILQSKIPSIHDNHKVRISPKDFLPEVYTPSTGDIVVTSFANLSSGGKKTFYKACFGLAIHRLAVEIGALLPNFLIIDSPMKNISERENWEQFVGFHDLVYRLAKGELSETQIIIIDKEYCAPEDSLDLDVLVRHMMPDSVEFPPLIPYYRGM